MDEEKKDVSEKELNDEALLEEVAGAAAFPAGAPR